MSDSSSTNPVNNFCKSEELEPGVTRKITHLKGLMMTIIENRNGPMAEPEPFHHHFHEQIAYVAEGRLKLFVEDDVYELQAGDTFSIESNLKHCIQSQTEVIKLVDAFAPIREDFLGQ
jgi:mannose-6-phosphate isomerase-like protein (cupin superfamily)